MLESFSPALRNLLVSDILIRFCEQIPYAYVVIWCVQSVAGYHTARITAGQFGILTSIEMATALICYLPGRVTPTKEPRSRLFLSPSSILLSFRWFFSSAARMAGWSSPLWFGD